MSEPSLERMGEITVQVWELALSGLEMAALAAFIYQMGPPPLGAARHVAWVNSVLGRDE